MTISLMTVAEGAAYAPFVSAWWESVQRMNPQPDEVVIVIGADDKAGVRAVVGDAPHVHLVVMDEPFSNAYFSRGMQEAKSEWVAFCGVDDRMMPSAYADVPAATLMGAEIIVGTIIQSNGAVWRGSWDPEDLQRRNTIPAHSPYRKELWQRVGGFPDIHWSDWGFWLKCLRENPVTYQGTQPLAIFDVGVGRETMSGVGLDPRKRIEADAELHAFRESLCLSV